MEDEPTPHAPRGSVPSIGTPTGEANAAGPGGGANVPITWTGSPWSLAGLSILNFVLSVITLGIYSFWGRTEVRRRVWSSVRLAGEPLEYTGTGKELFLGFLIVLGIVFVPISLFVLGMALWNPRLGPALAQLVLFPALFYLTGVAIYRARRYRLRRTNWRGIRGALEGNSWGYGWTYFWTAALIPVLGAGMIGAIMWLRRDDPDGMAQMMTSPLTQYAPLLLIVLLIMWLWLVPWRATKLQRAMTNDMWFGNQAFSFTGSARPLYARFVARWIGVVILAIATSSLLFYTHGEYFRAAALAQSARMPPPPMSTAQVVSLFGILLGAFFLYSIITAWYRAAQANIFAAATRYGGVPFRLAVTAGGLISVFVTNFFITLLSLGILRPVADARLMRYFIERLQLTGPVDLAAIGQGTGPLGSTGEGLAQAFDVDAF